MVLLRFIGFLTCSHGGNWNQQVGESFCCGVWPFVMGWQHLHEQNLKQVLQHLKKRHYMHRFPSLLNVMLDPKAS